MRFFKKKEFDPRKTAESFADRYQEVEHATLSHLQKYLIRRWKNFKEVGIPALVWLIVVMGAIVGVALQGNALGNAYKTSVPAAGGTYSEGIVGRIENFNPLYASSNAEQTVSRLLFSGLLKYDEQNNLTGDLAKSWNVNENGDVYTVELHDNIHWSDGSKITSEDVVFTVKAIQNESSGSPLAASWQRVKVTALNETTIRFDLPTTFPPFVYSLILGILPEHALGKTPIPQLRTNEFNSQPSVTSGSFTFQDTRQVAGRQEVRLARNEHHFGDKAMLERFTLYAYENYEDMVAAFNNHEISAAGGLQADDIETVKKQEGINATSSPLLHETFAFFNNSQTALQDVKVRQALSLAINRSALVEDFHELYQPLGLPLLPEQLGYVKSLDDQTFSPERANQLLDEAGWHKNKNGVREKEGKLLEFNLVASASDEYPKVAAILQQEWQDTLGVVIRTNLVQPSEFQQNVLIPHNYDILLYELAIGEDPDVYAYWHSSQARERGLNLSEYSSQTADLALESGRTRQDPALRAAKYQTFLEEWKKDVPAVALYRPTYGYAYRTSVHGFVERTLVEPVDRLYNVVDWTANTREAVITH